MLGVLVNTAAVILGSIIGWVFDKGIGEKFKEAIMTGIGLCTIYIGISGTLKGENTLVLIFSIILGALVGTSIDLDGKINKLGDRIEKTAKIQETKSRSFAGGFIAASLLFCVGAMAIVGSINAGLNGDNEMLFTKSILDFISSIILTASLGIGVILAAAIVFIFQGSIVMLAQYLEPILTQSAIAEITCAGSLLILALGFNLLKLARIKVANYLPALILVPLISWLATEFII